MHYVLLSVTIKLIKIYLGRDNVIKCKHKLSKSDINNINDRLIKITKCIPSFFVRKARTLEHIDRFRVTELRQILLYTGKIVFKNILNNDYYQHFLSLNIAISLLLSPYFSTDTNSKLFVKVLLIFFDKKGVFLFGNKFSIYNTHSLLHLIDDVNEKGSLDDNSAFKFVITCKN